MYPSPPMQGSWFIVSENRSQIEEVGSLMSIASLGFAALTFGGTESGWTVGHLDANLLTQPAMSTGSLAPSPVSSSKWNREVGGTSL